MKVIIFTNDNGGVSVCTPSGEVDIATVVPIGGTYVFTGNGSINYWAELR
jgi:hypothetical protein